MVNPKWFSNVSTFTIGWVISLFFWRLIRIDGIKAYLNILNIDFLSINFVLFIIIVSLIAGITFGSVQYYNEYLIKRKSSFKILLFKALLSHLLIMLFIYAFIFFAIKYSRLNSDILYKDFIQSPLIIANLLYSLLINTLIVIVMQLNKLFGKRNLIKLITGKFYNPKEEFRAFMFLDLESSTQFAEELGHIMYSKLIQDCFFDLNVIEKTKAEIYQYVGDEVVLTWKITKGVDQCIEAFYLFKNRLQSRFEYYESHYGITPVFKAGLHLGLVTVTEVGSLKREIAYHGDTLNIASRIQGQCKVFNKEFLISEAVFNYSKNKEHFKFEQLKELVLRGKREPTLLYSVT